MVEDEDDDGGEEDGNQADGQTEDPVVSDRHVVVEGGEHSTPYHHIQCLEEGNRITCQYTGTCSN